MPILKESPRMGTKCYIHEMQRPLELPYKHKAYHVCWICQTRLLELAKADVEFKLGEQVVTLSTTTTEGQEKKGAKKVRGKVASF